MQRPSVIRPWLWEISYFTIPYLNTRETAIVIWAAIFLLAVIRIPDVRLASMHLIGTFLSSTPVLLVLLCAALYEVLAVAALIHFNFSTSNMWKIAVVWYFSTAIAGLSNFKTPISKHLVSIVVKALTITAVVEFIVNLYTFPTIIELILVPLVAVTIMMLAFTRNDPAYRTVHKLFTSVSVVLGFSLVVYSIIETTLHRAEVLQATTLEELILPLLLGVWFLPIFYLVRFYGTMDTCLVPVRIALRSRPDLYTYARSRIVRRCRLSLQRLAIFQTRFSHRFYDVEDQRDVDALLRDFDSTLN